MSCSSADGALVGVMTENLARGNFGRRIEKIQLSKYLYRVFGRCVAVMEIEGPAAP
jgi:hypothetical protein